MIRLLGQSHYTTDGRSYCIETCEMLPLAGLYDVMLFEIRRDSEVFHMGVAFPMDVSAQISSIGLRFEQGNSLIEHGLAQLRRKLDLGVEEDGRVFESSIRGGAARAFGPALGRRHFA
mgnify:CR=1 FL=1